VRPGELGYRVVAVAHEDPLVELLCAAHGNHVVVLGRLPRERVKPGIRLVDELIEQHAPQAFLGPGIPREERAFDDLRQITQGKHRPVEVREVARKEGRFSAGELGARHARMVVPAQDLAGQI